MNKRWLSFNIYLLALFWVLVAAGCHSDGPKPKSGKSKGKEATRISFHLEMNPDGTDRCIQAPVFRQRPMILNVDRTPVLHEGHVQRAEVAEQMGAFEIRLYFDRTSTWLLDSVTVANRGRRLAILAQFGEQRWIAAPLLNRRITDGILSFTPDATRAETERIVRGLNNVAKEWQEENWRGLPNRPETPRKPL